MNKKMRSIIFLTLLVVIGGCTSIPKQLKQEDAQNIKKLAIVTFLADNNLKVIDQTRIRQKTYGGFMFGAIGALLEAAVLETEAQLAKRHSLGWGNPTDVKRELADYPIKKVFDDNFIKIFSNNYKNCEILCPQYLDSIETSEYPMLKSSSGKKIRDYSTLDKKLNVDTVLEIDFMYGLAVYEFERSSAIISGTVSVINIRENKLLMRDLILSDKYYKDGHTVNEFKADGAQLYKKAFLEAVDAFGRLVATDFGVATTSNLESDIGSVQSLKNKSYWNSGN